jgi:iron complex outermembrane recepter protein
MTNKFQTKLMIIAIITIAILGGFTANAQFIQAKGLLVGKQKPLAAATISVATTEKNQLVKTAVSDSIGSWLVELKFPGSYQFEFAHTGFVTKTQTVILDQNGKDLGQIELLEVSGAQKDIVVTARKQMIEVKPGKTIVNVDASPSNAGATAMDVLEKSPGVTVDKDGNISLKGKQGVVVMIDKRPTYMSANDLANMLRTMPAGQLEQIELITQPGSSFDAAGNAGIINLKLKKNKIKGSNGSVSTGLTQGYYLRNNQSLNYNYKNSKVNVFTNFSYDQNRRRQTLDVSRIFVDPITKQLKSNFMQTGNQTRSNEYMYGKVGLDYQADSNNIVGFVLEAGRSTGRENWINGNDILNSSNVIVNKSITNQSTPRDNRNISLNLNWRKTISKSASLFTDFDIINYNNFREQLLDTKYYNGAGQSTGQNDLQLGNLPSKINIYVAKMDYEKNYKNGAKLEAGAKASFVDTKNNAGYFIKQSGAWVVDNLRTNIFNYDENINAAYVSYSFSKGKKWEFNAGLRAEQTVSKGVQKINDSTFKRNYINAFLTFFGSYKINEKQSLSLSMGRRIQRPDYEDLNPFRFYLDQYTYELGNVFLQPQFAYNTELNYSMLGGAINHTVAYSFTNKAMTDILEQNDVTNETYITKKNLATKKNVNYALSINAPIKKWFNTSVYFETNYGVISGNINGANEKLNVSNWMVSVTNQFKISKKIKADLSFFYRGKGNEDLILISPMSAVNFGVSKTVLKGKGTLKLSARDVFNAQKFTASIKYGTVNTSIKQWNDRQTIGLNFTYRFSKGNKFQVAKKKEQSNDEKNRVKQN